MARVDDDDDLDQEIEAQVNEWSSNSTESMVIQLVRSDGSEAASFEPSFTLAMFGEEEAIFGYQGLEINLTFTAHDLKPKLSISHDRVFPAQKDVQPTDIEGALRPFLPDSAFEHAEGEAATSTGWTPPGERIQQYDRDGKKYEIWCASLADPKAKTLLENMQILTPLLIDGGSTLELEWEWTTARWKLFLLYAVEEQTEEGVPPYVLAGYATSYQSFTFPDRQTSSTSSQDEILASEGQTITDLLPTPSSTPNTFAISPQPSSPLQLPSRERLSQFVILPPNQSSGHGQALYNTIYTHLISPSYVREFTVEDPNEDFDQLRDVCDLLCLRRDPTFRSLSIHSDISSAQLRSDSPIPTDLIIPIEQRNSLNATYKLQSRQFARLVEIQALSNIPLQHRSKARITKKENASNKHDREYFFWRMYAKERLYIFNRDQLAEIDASDRVEKLDAALDSVMEGYLETLERVERIERERPEVGGIGEGKKRKRKTVVDDEEDDEEEEDSGRADVGGKKPKVG